MTPLAQAKSCHYYTFYAFEVRASETRICIEVIQRLAVLFDPVSFHR